MFCLKTGVNIRQFMHRNSKKLEEPPSGILFPGIDRSMADINTFYCLLYFCNYFFYLFGIEVFFFNFLNKFYSKNN